MSGYIGVQPVPKATQRREYFTATNGQTSFSTSGYTPEYIDVYMNGVKLSPADFTATNGSDVVLGSGAATGDLLQIISFLPFSVLNQAFSGTLSVAGALTAASGTLSGALGITQTGSVNTVPLSVNSNLNSGQAILELRSTGSANATIDLRADGTGDPQILFDLNGVTPFSIGVDNSDGDKFKISGTSQLGTNPRLTIDSSGNSTFAGTVTAKVPQTANTVMPVARITTSGTYNSSGSPNAGGALSFGQYDDSYPAWNLGQIAGIRLGNGWAGNLLFYTNSGGSQTNITEKARLDASGTLFLGTTTPTLHSSMTGIVLDNGSLLNETARGAGKSLTLAQNLAIDSGNTWAYLSTDEGSYYQQFNGNHYFGTAPSGSAGADATVTSKLTILNDGNVGIGETAPSAKLQVQGGTSGLDQISISSNTTANTTKYAGIIMTNYANTATALLGAKAENGTTSVFYGSSGSDHRGIQNHIFYTNASATATSGNTERMRIDNEGRVGIANDTPGDFNASGDDLVIGNSSGNRGITIRSGTSNSGNIFFADGLSGNQLYRGFIQYQHADDRLVLGTGGDDRVWISSSGNVGIGNATPSAPLDVVTNSNVYAAEFTQSNTSNGDGVFIQVGSTSSSEYVLTCRSNAGAVSALAVKADGKVGIGTFLPGYHLSVQGPTSDSGKITEFYGSRQDGALYVTNYLCGSDNDRVGLYWRNANVVNTRMWCDDTMDIRVHSGDPSSDTDGTVVGTQTFSGTHIYKTDATDLVVGQAVRLVGRKLVKTTSANDKLCVGIYAGQSGKVVDSFGQACNETDGYGHAVIALGDTRMKQSGTTTIGVLVDGSVEAGDLLCTSSTAGKLTAQADDIIRSYTVGKAIEDGNASAPVYAYIYCG